MDVLIIMCDIRGQYGDTNTACLIVQSSRQELILHV